MTAYLAGAAGLLLIYRGLRRDFTTGVAFLSTLLCAAGTSLLSAIIGADDATVLTFAIVAALIFEGARLNSPMARPLAWGAAALVPLALRFTSGGEPQSLFGIDGFFSLTPTTYVALVGTLAAVRRDAFWAAMTIAVLALWFVTSSNLIAAISPLAPGLALAIDWVRRRPLVAIAPLVAWAIAWNYWLMVQYTAGLIPKDAPVSFSAMVRQQADVHTRVPYRYPLAFPANVVFAWWEGVPVDRFEVLAAEPQGEEFELAIDRRAQRFLLDGWGPPGTNESGPFRWVDAPRATLAFPLQPSGRDLTLEVLVTARGASPSPMSDLTFELNGHAIGHAQVSPVEATEVRIRISSANVGRVLRAGYNRLSIVNAGSHRIAIHRVRIVPAS